LAQLLNAQDCNRVDTNNLDQIINICSNLTQIIGVRFGASFILSAVLISFLKDWRAVRKYFFIGICITGVALAAPSALQRLASAVASPHEFLSSLALRCGCIFGSFMLVLQACWLLAYPVTVAKKLGKKDLNTIIGLSAFSIILLPLWPVALLLAHKPHKANAAGRVHTPV
jgi:hypothetical protein